MKQFRLLPIIVVPLLLSIVGLVAYLTIKNGWSVELLSTVIFLFTAVYLLLFEQIIPFKQEWKSSKIKRWSDLKHLVFSTIIFDALGKAFALSAVLWLKEEGFPTFEIWTSFPFVLSLISALLIGELLPYYYHRISHLGKENSYVSLFLWRIHSIHHLPESLNWFKTNWIHPINMFLNTFLKMTPLFLLGFSENILFLVGVLHVVIAYVSHANIQTKTGFLDYLIVTPKIHQFHHSENLEEAKNFGNIIPFWDLVFKTYYNRKGTVDKVGVIKSYINYPKKGNYLAQLIFPFKNIYKGCCPPKKRIRLTK